MSYDGYTSLDLKDGEKHLGGNVKQGDPHTFCPTIWNYMIDKFCLNSVMDLGSGLGYAAHYFYKKGCKVIAVEGLKINCTQALYPTVHHDLTTGPLYCNVDLVHCQEMVEHLEEKYIDNLIDTLSCGNVILMTHALPNQPGHHHVNCKPKEYWVDLLKNKGYNYLDEDTKRIRVMADKDGSIYMKQSGLVFARI